MIVVVTQTFAPAKGGMETYLTGLAENLAGAGFETLVLADSNKSIKGGSPLAAHAFSLKSYGGLRPWRRWRKRGELRGLLASGRISAIYCDSWKSVEALPSQTAVPVVVLAHGSEYPDDPSSRKHRRIKLALSRVTCVLANSQFTADAVRPFLRSLAPPNLAIVHPPLNPLPAPTELARARIKSIVGDCQPVLCALARLEPRKGIDMVISALPALTTRYPSLVFLVAGDGKDRPRLEALAGHCGVERHVTFLGRIPDDDKYAMLSGSNIFAMPVRRVGRSVEGFGISYCEAAWFGVPSIGGNGSGASDAIIDGETGLLCNGNDLSDVTAAIARLLDDPAFARRLGAAAQVRARQELTWNAQLPRFLEAAGIS